MTHSDFSDNRFEKLYQKLKKKFGDAKPKFWRRLRRIFVWGVLAFIVIEIGAVGLAIDKLASYGVPSDVARHHFYLTRYTLNLFLDTPTIDEFERSTNSRYTGFEQACTDFNTDVFLGWRNKPGVSCSFLYPSGGVPDGAGLMWNAYDADGFVPSDKSLPRYKRDKPDDVLRIIVLGGSTLASFGSSPFDSIPGHLQRMLGNNGSDGDKKVRFEVINAGVGGYNSAQEYLYLMSELVYYKPDIVVFYDGWNESINRHGHFSDATFAYLRKVKKFKPVPFSSVRTIRHRDYNDHIDQSYTPTGAAVILKDAIGRWLSDKWLHTGIRYWGWKYRFRKNWKRFWKGIFGIFKKIGKRPSHVEAIKVDFDPRSLKVFEENIHRSAILAGLRGFKVLFALQPVIGVDSKSYAPGNEQNWANSEIGKAKILRRKRFYDIARPSLKALAEEYGDRKNVCFADMSSALSDVKETVYVDEGHLNSLGNRVVASAMIKQLAKCDFF